MKWRAIWAIGLGLLAGFVWAADHQVSFSKKGKFDDVRDDLVTAIEGRGIKINHFNHIAEMLARTGSDLGASKQVFVQGEQIEFCKSEISRMTMEASAANIVFCPYIISIYTEPAQPDLVRIAYRLPVAPDASPATSKALKAVDDLLRGIVSEAVR